MIENEKELKEILFELDKSNLLKDLILIGSWTQLFYKKIFENFKPNIRTTDIDFYVPNVRTINETKSLIKSLKSRTYILNRDTLSNKTKFQSANGFELEFLTNLNREHLSTMKLGNTGIYAECLPYLDMFTGNYIEVEFEGLMVKVASPASYILQKLLINSDRKTKSEKDIESVKYVLNFVKSSKKYSYELTSLYESLPKSWKNKINVVIKKNNILL